MRDFSTIQLHLDRSRNETNVSDLSNGERLSENIEEIVLSETCEVKNSLLEQYEWKDTIGGSQVLQCGTSKVCRHPPYDINHLMLRNSARNLADGKGRWTCPGALFRPGEHWTKNFASDSKSTPLNSSSRTSQASTDWSRVYVPVSHFGHRPWHWQLLVGQVYCNFLGFSNVERKFFCFAAWRCS